MWLASLIFGSIGLLLSWVPVFGAGLGIPAAIVGTALGAGSLVTTKTGPESARRRSQLALAISAAGLIAGVVFALIYR